jgi:hypothetical protein
MGIADCISSHRHSGGHLLAYENQGKEMKALILLALAAALLTGCGTISPDPAGQPGTWRMPEMWE